MQTMNNTRALRRTLKSRLRCSADASGGAVDACCGSSTWSAAACAETSSSERRRAAACVATSTSENSEAASRRPTARSSASCATVRAREGLMLSRGGYFEGGHCTHRHQCFGAHGHGFKSDPVPCGSVSNTLVSALAESVDSFLHYFSGHCNSQARLFHLSCERILRSACRGQPIPADRCHCSEGSIDTRSRGGSQAEARGCGRFYERQDVVTRVCAHAKHAGSHRARGAEKLAGPAVMRAVTRLARKTEALE